MFLETLRSKLRFGDVFFLMLEADTNKVPGVEGARSPTDEVCLVIGDWFVDEHWVCGVHRSSSSSRTGRSHLRALHSATSAVRAFCGAGRSAFFLHYLYRVANNSPPLKSVIGLGFWHRTDTENLISLFDPQGPAQTPCRLSPPELKRPTGIELINMNDALNMEDDGYTTRIIRIYTQGESDRFVYDRLDWEPRTPQGDLASTEVPWPKSKLETLGGLLLEKLQGRTVRAVMIKDMLKGVVNRSIIDWLLSTDLAKVPWFVSSKRWCPKWLQNLGDGVDLRLLMVPEVAAQAALYEEQSLSCWITRSGRPSKEAVKVIDTLATFTKAKNVVVFPRGFSALACECTDRGVANCVVQSETKPEKITVDMGFASIAFPALVALLLVGPND